MIPSLLGLHFSSIGVLKLSISALLAWAKIAVHALLVAPCIGSDRGRQTFLVCLKLQCIKEPKSAVDKPYEKGLWKE
jgi:hypothetical protein